MQRRRREQSFVRPGTTFGVIAEWMTMAACIGQGDLFLRSPHVDSAGFLTPAGHAAKEICAGCPVKAECREHARRHREPAGMWGGETCNERGYQFSGGLAPTHLRKIRDEQTDPRRLR